MSTRLRTVLYHTRSALFDFLARIFALPVPPDVNRDTPDTIEILTDEDAFQLFKLPEAIAHNQHLAQYWRSFGGIKALQAPAWKIAPTLIAKHISPFERDNTLFIRSHTNIPVPQPRCLHLNQVYVSEFVPGRMLLACWDSLSWFTQFHVACTLRNYVKIMRSLTRDIPGSVNGGHIYGQIFEMPPLCNGPFRTAEIFQNWFEHITHVGWLLVYSTSSPPPVFPDETDWTPVFNHCDLNLSNILLSDDSVLWTID
ncbi:hypothetical protein CPC08DRAFT_168988 [Agrocybe pediades]|nr:hypothetical protein CPC08DRAFT_168988 [Agrocybe pediades]